jgi:alpha-L-rhamnosidase
MHRRRTQLITSVTSAMAAIAVTFAAPLLPASAGSASSVTVGVLRTDGRSAPLGIDDASPALSWQVTSPARRTAQTAYQVQVATTGAGLASGTADLWDTGKVAGSAQRVEYAGDPLGSRARAVWRVRVWDRGAVSAWSDPATFELGLLDPSDWQAHWVANQDWRLSQKAPHPVTVTFPESTARFVRIDVTRLGLPLAEQPLDSQNRIVLSGEARRFPAVTHRLQLAEVQVRDSAHPEVNLASGLTKNVTASETETIRKQWEPGLVADNITTSNPQEGSYSGYQSAAHAGTDVSDHPIWLTVDLGQTRTFDQVQLYPRTDTLTADGRTPGFPMDYAVETAAATSGPFAEVAEVQGQTPPEPWLPQALPLFAKDFRVTGDVASARLHVAGLGIYVASLNGHRVGGAVLEPANTDYRDRVSYATYDVASLIGDGENTIGLALGNGTANALHTNGRYRKFARTTSDPQAIAQLEITRTDGSTEVVASDGSWLTTLGPTTASSWYGGEDHDARRELPGWDAPGADRAGWASVVEVGQPAGSAVLSARDTEPVRVVERLNGTEIGLPAQGVRVFDVGRDIAGLPEVTLDAPAGTVVRVYPAESLRNGHVDQSISNVGAPIWDQLTSVGARRTWHPDFGYHAFRYLEVVGLPDGAEVSVAGLRVMADNPSAGTFATSDPVLDGIHRLTRHALENNMMSVLTDCPSREKLGWLEQDHLAFDTIVRNYDVESYLPKIVQDIADGQESTGMVPSTVPDYTTLAGAYRDDPNWGGALVRIPVQYYETYGDDRLIRRYYPQMQRYLDYLDGQSARWVDGVYDYSLGDWITTEKPVMPRAVTGSFGVWAIADGLAEAAAAIGRPDDAARYREQADQLSAAVWRKFYDPVTGRVAGGGMGATALALDMGAVPADQRDAQLTRLVDLIRAAGWHLVMGEISFPSVLRVLSGAGRDDVVLQIAEQTTSPSLGFQVQAGLTALGETWDGGSGQSQSHFMLGALDGWLTTRLTGIGQVEGSVGFSRLLIDPAVVGDLTSASGSYVTPYGEVRTAWTRNADATVLDLTVPSGSTAEVHVPVHRDASGAVIVPSANGAQLLRIDGDEAVFDAPSGTWRFISPTTD